MNEVSLGLINDIKKRLQKILDTTSGKFSIEQLPPQNNAVLLKICQQFQNEKTLLFILVIDEGLNIGVCSTFSINAGISPFNIKRSYSYQTETFAPWIKTHVAEKLAA